jgi:hypothetical protein
MTTLSDMAGAHIALAASADEIVQAFAAKVTELAASERALRSAYVAVNSGQTQFPKAGQTGIANYLATLADRIVAGEQRPKMLKSVGDLAASAWEGVAA